DIHKNKGLKSSSDASRDDCVKTIIEKKKLISTHEYLRYFSSVPQNSKKNESIVFGSTQKIRNLKKKERKKERNDSNS
ncbi:hypothetical protein BG74_06130, partial [Sodalis-like endosymbiont of Proechinophthirus fluctus]|uniref:hypothetical protein n=1 Tax=Sodalis-like endosymbiont of Proechinophthirus fluctus TaxID=1462730 RepID=UPI0007A83476